MRRVAGFSLVELLVIIALVGCLVVLGHWGLREMVAVWRVQRAAQQVLEDLKQVQGQAEQTGSLFLTSGALVAQRYFLVFDPDLHTYELNRWRDADTDGQPEEDESELLWQRQLPEGVRFRLPEDVTRKACSNRTGVPSDVVTFARPDYAPCLDRPCLKFDAQGYSVIGPGAIYLGNDTRSMAITGTRPGHFTVCRWNGVEWE